MSRDKAAQRTGESRPKHVLVTHLGSNAGGPFGASCLCEKWGLDSGSFEINRDFKAPASVRTAWDLHVKEVELIR